MRRPARLAALALLTLSSVGCKDAAPSAAVVRSVLEEQLPGASFERDFHLRLGRVVMTLARGLVRMVEDDPDAREVLSHVNRLEIASYVVDDLPDLSAVGLPAPLEGRMSRLGWQPLVRSRDDESLVWIFVRPREDGSISNLYIVDLDPDELTVIDLRGRIDRLMANAIAEDPSGFADKMGA